MKYRFGIGSQLFELESDDEILAKVSMCLFYKKDIPIGIYSPINEAIQPKEVLEKNFVYCQKNNEALIKVMDSIIEVKDD